MRKKTLRDTAILIVFFLSVSLACQKHSPEYGVARRFIDAYYVMADHDAALLLADQAAKIKIESEKNLLANVEARDSAYKSRDVEFTLLKQENSAGQSQLFFELTLHVAGLDPIKKNVFIVIDQKSERVIFFGDSL